MSDEHLAKGPDWQAGYDAALDAVRVILAAGRTYDVLPAAAAMVDVGLLDPETAVRVMCRAAAPERLKEAEGADASH